MKGIRMYNGGEQTLSAEQLYVAEILATPGRASMTLEEIGDAVGVSPRTISRWRAQPEFARYVQARTVAIVGERLPEIMHVVADRAEKGSAKHAELIFKSLGLLKDHLTVQPQMPDDDRSDASIEAEIERLRKELGELDDDIQGGNEL
ncbi:phBC6A51 family helix-turn-helix protein [Paenibacillus cremeus]|uniref:Homeodomain phBC6A51-type domain-containing protein n=1 Tax=Paenibacillus cremeus TaxID=2163881 RepID=A0A559JMA3_9BACL|nr:phBC6A51 family helix-turn-helix protein [Paenibacillus cremeus]TVY00999.1 hypothetical protein FPZ49_32930 [Paenibacillus cremeus]